VKYVISVIFMFMVSVSMSYAGGIGDYSNGYRIGMLTKFSVKGLMFKSGEGQMLMGRESTPYVYWKGSGDSRRKVTVNPWYFSSTSKNIQRKLMENIGTYVVLKYKQSHVKMPNVDTDYEIVDVGLPTRSFGKVCVAKNYHKGHKSEGARVGRIVKLSEKGTMFNSYELIVQQGNSGNQFKNMSLPNDKNMFNCALAALKSGKMVKVTYSQSIVNLDIIGRSTSYDAIRIEEVGDL